MTNRNIFVQIPAYRDPELPLTLEHMLENSHVPDNLHIGICHQYKRSDAYLKSLSRFKNYSNIKFIEVPYDKSQGLGWARALAANLYADETYYCQLDSHHRFAKDWDIEMIEMLENIKSSKKPIIATHPPSYKPDQEKSKYIPPENYCLKIVPVRFVDSNNIIQRRPQHGKADSPFPARFIAGGCLFTHGHFIVNIPPDPYIHFNEEMPLCLRAFTHGYDLFHPHRHVIWHEYSRNDKPKLWKDKEAGRARAQSNYMTKKRIYRLVYNAHKFIDLGKYGLGKERTLSDYEEYTGIDFKKQIIHPDALLKRDPPTFTNKEIIGKKTYKFKQDISNVYRKLESLDTKDIEAIHCVIVSNSNHEIYRKSYSQIYNRLKKEHELSITTDQKPERMFFIITTCGKPSNNFIYEYEL